MTEPGRRIRYQVACSLDSYIADADDGYAWIPEEPDVDFEAMFAEFDTLLMGRRTYEVTGADFPDHDVYVFSRTLDPDDHPDVTVVSENVRETVEELRDRPGKDIWLFGGGELFRSLLELDLVDTIEPAVVPVVLGDGRPMLPGPPTHRELRLTYRRVFEHSGIVQLRYEIVPPTGER